MRPVSPPLSSCAATRFPVAFANLYGTGEITGSLQDALRRMHTMYREEGKRKLAAFAMLVPRLIYVLILLYLGYTLVRSATRCVDLLDQVWKG